MDKNTLKKIIQVSKGSIPADLVIRNAQIVDVLSGEITSGDIAINGKYIAGVGSYEGKKIVDADGLYATSGLIDSHVHVESSLSIPTAFAKMVIPHGTTTVIADPHEIANVRGIAGVKFMIESAKSTPLRFHFMIPSCVPATEFEDAGAILDYKEIASIIGSSDIFGLGEMMNFPGVLNSSDDTLEKLALAHNENKIIDGHGPMLDGKLLNAYTACGVKTDHECVSVHELKDRIANGMYVFLRHGSAAQNLSTLLQGVNDKNFRRCALCTDDKHSSDIITNGHINHSLRIAVSHGIDVFTAISMATINGYECYGIKDRGLIAPGYLADIVLFRDLKDFNVDTVFIGGEMVAQNKKALFSVPSIDISTMSNSVNIHNVSKDDLVLPIKKDTAKVIRLSKFDLVTESYVRIVGTENGNFDYRDNVDILKLVVVERHKKTGRVGVGLVENYKLKNGAVATTIGHDSHNLIVIGDNDNDIISAIKELECCGGGITLVQNGVVLSTFPLPVAGIMSDEDGEVISERIEKMNEIAFEQLGVNRNIDPFMTLSFLTLPVIPDLKLTPRGLFDVTKFEFTDING